MLIFCFLQNQPEELGEMNWELLVSSNPDQQQFVKKANTFPRQTEKKFDPESTTPTVPQAPTGHAPPYGFIHDDMDSDGTLSDQYGSKLSVLLGSKGRNNKGYSGFLSYDTDQER